MQPDISLLFIGHRIHGLKDAMISYAFIHKKLCKPANTIFVALSNFVARSIRKTWQYLIVISQSNIADVCFSVPRVLRYFA